MIKTIPPPFYQGQPLFASGTPPAILWGAKQSTNHQLYHLELDWTLILIWLQWIFLFASNDVSKTTNVVQERSARTRILTFNCKNIATSKIALQEFYEKVGADIYFYKNIGCLTVTYTDSMKSHSILEQAKLLILTIPSYLYKCPVAMEGWQFCGKMILIIYSATR